MPKSHPVSTHNVGVWPSSCADIISNRCRESNVPVVQGEESRAGCSLERIAPSADTRAERSVILSVGFRVNRLGLINR